MPKSRAFKPLFQASAVLLALGLTTLVLLATKAPPLAAYASIARGAVGSWVVASDVLVAWVPLLLATSGLLVTFTVGLWNIGIEGQITFGAVFATWALRSFQAPVLGAPSTPASRSPSRSSRGWRAALLWAMLVGALKTFGGVNEIFGGLGLNYVATALNLWLIFGPWKRPGVASMSGTVPFDKSLWLPTISEQSRFAPVAAVLAIVAIADRVRAHPGHVFRPPAQGGRQESQGRLPPRHPDLAVHDGLLRDLRPLRRPRGRGTGDRRVPQAHPLDILGLRLPGPHGVHARQLQRGAGRARSPVLRGPQRRLDPAADHAQAGLLARGRAPGHPGPLRHPRRGREIAPHEERRAKT